MMSICAAVVGAPSAAAEEPLWSNEVRRIDPSQQTYERLPPKPPTVLPNARPKGSFRLRGFFRVRDSVSFVYKKKSYRLSGAEPVANSKICLDEQGRRWGCGIIARNSLVQLLKSRDVFCVPTREAEQWTYVDCGKDGLDVATDMIENGFAVAP
ncbi:MAG: hypothetical protein RIC18_18190 [Hoeflea sp.]